MSTEVTFVASGALVVFMKIVCFILGYLTIRLGYKLIDAGVKGSFKFSASLGGAKADLASVSPGLLFVLLGVFLIGYAIYVNKAFVFTPVASGSVSAEPGRNRLTAFGMPAHSARQSQQGERRLQG